MLERLGLEPGGSSSGELEGFRLGGLFFNTAGFLFHEIRRAEPVNNENASSPHHLLSVGNTPHKSDHHVFTYSSTSHHRASSNAPAPW